MTKEGSLLSKQSKFFSTELGEMYLSAEWLAQKLKTQSSSGRSVAKKCVFLFFFPVRYDTERYILGISLDNKFPCCKGRLSSFLRVWDMFLWNSNAVFRCLNRLRNMRCMDWSIANVWKYMRITLLKAPTGGNFGGVSLVEVEFPSVHRFWPIKGRQLSYGLIRLVSDIFLLFRQPEGIKSVGRKLSSRSFLNTSYCQLFPTSLV